MCCKNNDDNNDNNNNNNRNNKNSNNSMTSSTILDTNIDIGYREEHEQKKVG